MNDSQIQSATRLCTGADALRNKYSRVSAIEHPSIESLILALEEFQECIRYLNTRRSKGAVISLNSEADVQDALYLMLRPWVRDLIPENPTDRIASRYTIGDFLSRNYRVIIEAKYIRDTSHGKYISKELNDDIEMYRHHPDCDHLVFFIYDPDSLIPDQSALRQQIEISRSYANRCLACHLVIKP